MTRTLRCLPVCLLLCVLAQPAYAFRPFDSTDAAVATKGDMELECGPFGYVVESDGRFLVAPSAIFNFGIAKRWELVIEGRNFFQIRSVGADRRDTLRETALSVKTVLREGSLQDRDGPSVAVEAGLLLPGVGAEPGLGASVAGIVSQDWSAVTVHINGTLVIAHDHTLGAIAGAIVEGPSRWAVRPVAEMVLAQDVDRTVSGLVGGIWEVRHTLSLDGGWRMARTNGATVREFRAGFTWDVPLAPDASLHDVVIAESPMHASRDRYR